MIIFDLDGTLADCEHRQHFVDPYKNPSYEFVPKNNELGWKEGWYCNLSSSPYFGMPWKANWPAFYEACDKDKPIDPVIEMLDGIYFNASTKDRFFHEIQIWSARCESVRGKTVDWLNEHVLFDGLGGKIELKMRPIGDSTPDELLKQKWLEEAIAEGKTIDFVFDDRPKVIRMWRDHGIFVFNCCQHDNEF